MSYYQGLGETKLVEYCFNKTRIKFILSPGSDEKTVYVNNEAGHITREIFDDDRPDLLLTDANSKGVHYKYLEYDEAGNWTKRYMLNTNGALILQTRYYNYY